ncbi:small-conductance mechanosensitive channel [Radiobacillus sp. PE A8.2]|uniref:small-conductance mechanosensitive channel n=1 Tax=Radiobacillus sp. PE A8.2 TaxID=3380349 RepID=UPI00388E2D87
MEAIKKNNESVQVISEAKAMDKFHQQAHLWGRIPIWVVMLVSITMPLYLSFVVGYHPGWQPIIAGFLAYAAIMALGWALEPVLYFPTLGISGTYLAFLTGNISNMCLPSAAAAQHAIGAEPGTRKGEITATLAMGAASLVNIAILIPIIFTGSYLLSILPESVYSLFEYVLPAIFGAIVGQFAMRRPLFGAIGIAIAIVVAVFAPPALQNIFVPLIATIAICVWIDSKVSSKEAS